MHQENFLISLSTKPLSVHTANLVKTFDIQMNLLWSICYLKEQFK